MITGIVSLNGAPVKRADIENMTDVTKAFAPDGTDIWHQGPTALSCNLLNVLPDSRFEPQPVVRDDESKLILVADARIDNRGELFDTLGISLPARRQISDARLILKAFKKWGPACAPRLIGDFAFAIRDLKTGALFCGRDVFGIKPFYYHHARAFFAFASDVHALLALKKVPTEIDELWIADTLGGLHNFQKETPYKAIQALPPAHTLMIEAGAVRMKRYWVPDLSIRIRYPKDDAYVDRYRELFTEAVGCRLAGHGPKGAASLISGGLDSSSISAVAARLLREQGNTLFAFCHVLPVDQSNPEGDEKALVQLLEQTTDGLYVTFVSADNFLPETSNRGNSYDPFSLQGNRFFGTTLLLAQQNGARVLLDGFGGDQVVTCQGSTVIPWAVRRGNIPAVIRQVRALAGLNKRPVWRTTLGLLRQHHPFQNGGVPEKQIRDFLYDRCALNKDFADRINIMQLARSAHRFKGHHPMPLNEVMFEDLTSGKTPNKLDNGLLARYRMEKRYPMYDRRLVEFCLAVPPEQHRLGMGRRLIRRAMQGILPDEIRLRDNKRYSASPGIRQLIFQDLHHHRHTLAQVAAVPEVAGYVDLEKIRRRFDELPDLIAHGKQKNFILGATTRALHCAQVLAYHYGKQA